MIVLIPDIVTGANIASSNVPLEPAWAAGTYSYLQTARVGDDLYEVAATGGTTQEPTEGVNANPPTWRLVGKINRLRAHDHISQPGVVSPIDTSTVNPSSISYEITGKSKFTKIEFLNLNAASVRVEVTDPIAGVIKDETQQLRRRNVIDGSWWNWLFQGAREKSTATFDGIPLSSNPTINITIEGAGDVSVGAILIGRPRFVGETGYAPEIDEVTYSSIEINPREEKTILRSPSAKRGRFKIHLDRGREEAAQRLFNEIEAVACLFSANVAGASVYGFKERVVMIFDGPRHTELQFTAKGQS